MRITPSENAVKADDLSLISSNDPSQAFVSYMKSVHLQKDKSIFDLTQLPIEAFAASLGLPGAPQIKFIGQAHQKKNAARGKLQQEEQKDKAHGVKVNVAGEKETETANAKVGTQVELADSESDESEVGSGDEDEEVDSEEELQAGKVDGDSESDADDDDVDAKDDVPTSKKVCLCPFHPLKQLEQRRS